MASRARISGRGDEASPIGRVAPDQSAEYSARHGILPDTHPRRAPRTRALQLLPWEYIFQPFNKPDFPDLYTPTWVASLVLLIVLGVLYWQRTKALHRHQPFLDMWEWLWWTGLITFSLLLIESLFVFDFFLVVATAIIGIGTLVWIRFRRFPPI